MTIKNRIIKTIGNSRFEIIICLFLIIATSAVYMQITSHEFISYDDYWLIRDNDNLHEGLTFDSIAWAFNSGEGYWKPLTFLSLMLDYELYGMDAGGFLLTNLLFHILNSILLFFVFKKMTGKLWQSSFVAVLFALHPIHVESVAWASERKDVLSTFFWMLTMWFYVRYADRPDVKRFLPVILFLMLGLMAKPMVVTLPFVLLLLDYWPLNRFQPGDAGVEKPELSVKLMVRNGFRLVKEKLLLFCLTAFSVFMILSASLARSKEALPSYLIISLTDKIKNVLISYVSYIGKMFWPFHLAIPYPFNPISSTSAAGALVLLLIITFFAVKTAKSRPYFIIGWFWYLGTLVPVIGLINFCPASMADRFTYVPLIGLFIIIAWGWADFFKNFPYPKRISGILFILLAFMLMHRTWTQAGYWKNNASLFKHAIKVTTGNYVAHNNLGNEFFRQGLITEAAYQFAQSIKIQPDHAKAHYNLANALRELDKTDKAITHYLQAIDINPNYEKACNNLASLLLDLGRTDEAITYYKRTLLIDPHFPEAEYNLANAYKKIGHIDKAIYHYRLALKINPLNADAHYNLANALKNQGHLNKAIGHYRQAIGIQANNEKAHTNLATVLMRQGLVHEAIDHYLKALKINPDHVNARYNLGIAYFTSGNFPAAADNFKAALRLHPDSDAIRAALNQAMERMN